MTFHCIPMVLKYKTIRHCMMLHWLSYQTMLTLSSLQSALVWSKTMNGRIHCSYLVLKRLSSLYPAYTCTHIQLKLCMRKLSFYKPIYPNQDDRRSCYHGNNSLEIIKQPSLIPWKQSSWCNLATVVLMCYLGDLE